MKICVNTRALNMPLTGVQRYLKSIIPFLDGIEQISPINGNSYIGHIWEQFVLPVKIKGKVLWSPCNTGPIFHKNQIITIHDIAVIEHPEWFSKAFASWYAFLWPRLLVKVKHIVTVSEYSKNKIANLYNIDPSRISVVPACLDKDFIEYTSTGKREDEILFVGSMDPRKNVQGLLQAWTIISKKHPDYKLIVVGAKSKIFSKFELVNNLQNVVFTGRVTDDELVQLYRRAKLFVFPSFYEGFGLPPLEAMSQGCPVVVSHTTSLPEVCGDAALFVNPYDEKDIAEKIIAVISDKNRQEEMSKKGVERAKRYHPSIIADKLKTIINSV